MSRRKVIMQFLLGITQRTKEFIARVEGDGGKIESPRCVAKNIPAETK